MLVGRDAELAVLDALITQAKAGAGGVVLLTGEPGVGKTRLARAGTEHAAGTMVSWEPVARNYASNDLIANQI